MSSTGRHRRSTYTRRRRAFAGPPPSRMQRLRVLAVLLALSVGATVAAAWFGPRFLDWGQYRATVEAVASAGLGRPVRIAGPIRLSLLPEATLVAGDVTLADTGDGASATASQLRLRVALGALLAGHIEPQDLALRDAHMRLPWPLTTMVSRRLAAPAGLHARVEDGTLAVGGLQFTAIEGELRVDRATGDLSAVGLASVMGRSWHMTGRLGRAGTDGSATVEVTLDGQGTAVGTGGTLSGQIAADGTLAGRISGRGPDLSLLLPAPSQAWQADGQVRAGSGLVVADDLELTIGGSPARGAVAVRLLPALRLDAALATSRLDLGAWLPPLLRGRTLALPTGIDLSADAADLAGGVLRHLRTGFDIGPDGVTLREADAELPGSASLHVSGRLADASFAGDARLAAPDVRQTLAWLRPRMPALIDAVPQGAVQAVHATATVTAGANSIMLTNLSADADGMPVTGDVMVRGGSRPALAAKLQLTSPALDRWIPQAPSGLAEAAQRLTSLPRLVAGFDADVTIAASAPTWHGAGFDRLVLDAHCRGGAVDIHQATLTGQDVSLNLVGTLSAAGQIRDGRLDVALGHAEILTGSLPAGWEQVRPLFHGPVTLRLVASGLPNALGITAAAALSDARAQVDGTLDLPGRHWKGAVSLHHPGSPRLLYALGLGDTAGWLGDGSLSFQATADITPDRAALSGAEMSAGSLRASGELAVTALASDHPVLTGTIAAETLPLPSVGLRSNDPWTLTMLHAADAKLSVRAAHLLWGLSPFADAAAATVAIANGAIHVDGFTARVAGGMVTARIGLEDASPPRWTLTGKLADVAIDGPLYGTPVDVVAGHLDAGAKLFSSGYSPAGMLANLAGPVQLTIQDGAVTGLDAGRVVSSLRSVVATGNSPDAAAAQSAVAEALRSGVTPFTRLEADGTLSHGTITLGRGAVTLPSGSIAATGSVDLPEEAIDVHLALQPALETAPVIGLRLIGPVAAPSRSPELAGLARWLAER